MQVSRDYRDLLQAHHQLQDDLHSTQRCKKQLRTQAVVRIVQLQAQMRTLRHKAATTQQQLQFYQATYPTTAVPDDFSPHTEDEEDTEQEDASRMETLPYQPDELDSEDEETPSQSIDRLTTSPSPYRMVRSPHPQMTAPR